MGDLSILYLRLADYPIFGNVLRYFYL